MRLIFLTTCLLYFTVASGIITLTDQLQGEILAQRDSNCTCSTDLTTSRACCCYRTVEKKQTSCCASENDSGPLFQKIPCGPDDLYVFFSNNPAVQSVHQKLNAKEITAAHKPFIDYIPNTLSPFKDLPEKIPINIA